MRTPKYTRPKGRASRLAIVEEAYALFAERGHLGTTLNEVARRVGMTLPGLLHHFSTKEELLLEVVRTHEEEATASINAHFSAESFDLQAAIEALAAANQSAAVEQLLIHTLSSEAVRADHPLHEYFTSRYEDNRNKLTSVLERARDAGAIRADVDAAAAAREIIATLDGLRLQWLLDPDRVPLGEALADYAKHVVAALAPPETHATTRRARRR